MCSIFRCRCATPDASCTGKPRSISSIKRSTPYEPALCWRWVECPCLSYAEASNRSFYQAPIAAYSRHWNCGKRKPCLQWTLLQHTHWLMYSLSHISDDPQQPRRANYSVDRCEYRAQRSDICGCNENTFRCTVFRCRTTVVSNGRYWRR